MSDAYLIMKSKLDLGLVRMKKSKICYEKEIDMHYVLMLFDIRYSLFVCNQNYYYRPIILDVHNVGSRPLSGLYIIM